MLEEQLGPTQFETVDANAGVVQLRGVAATFDRRICEIWMVRIRANDMFDFIRRWRNARYGELNLLIYD